MASSRRTRRQRLGAAAEDQAARILRDAGLSIMDRNFRTRFGEIDIIARDGNTLVFVEVRYRQSQNYGGAKASVTRPKQRKLQRAAELYLSTQADLYAMPMRFDVIAFDDGKQFEWIKRAFLAAHD